MTRSTSTALVPVPVAKEPATRPDGCGGHRRSAAGRTMWLVLAAVALAAAALALGSAWLGFAAILPLLYTLPCLLMVAMCMRGMKSGGSGDGHSSN